MAQFPTATMYRESILNSFGLTRTIGLVSPCLDYRGMPISFCGAWAVVFKVYIDDNRSHPYALKCYLKEGSGASESSAFLSTISSDYVVSLKFLEDELYVYDEQGEGSYYSVSIMDWVEGETLCRTLQRLCRPINAQGGFEPEYIAQLKELAERFDRFALWLLSQEFAHGDLKGDNIIVDEQMGIHVVDYDNIYLPSCGRATKMVFSPDYQHPLREGDSCGLWIDDYSLALISLSLHALIEMPELFNQLHNGANIIFDPRMIGCSSLIGEVSKSDRAYQLQILSDLNSLWERQGRGVLVALSKAVRSTAPNIDNIYEIFSRLTSGPNEDTRELELFCLDGLYGYRSPDGQTLIEPIYQDAHEFSYGMAAVRSSSGWIFIDRSSRMVIDCRHYKSIDPFRDSMARVESREGFYGFIDLSGAEIISPIYAHATSFRDGLAAARIDALYGYIDYSGEWVVEAKYSYDELRKKRA